MGNRINRVSPTVPQCGNDSVLVWQVQQSQQESHFCLNFRGAHPVDAAEVAQRLRDGEFGKQRQFLN